MQLVLHPGSIVLVQDPGKDLLQHRVATPIIEWLYTRGTLRECIKDCLDHDPRADQGVPFTRVYPDETRYCDNDPPELIYPRPKFRTCTKDEKYLQALELQRGLYKDVGSLVEEFDKHSRGREIWDVRDLEYSMVLRKINAAMTAAERYLEARELEMKCEWSPSGYTRTALQRYLSLQAASHVDHTLRILEVLWRDFWHSGNPEIGFTIDATAMLKIALQSDVKNMNDLVSVVRENCELMLRKRVSRGIYILGAQRLPRYPGTSICLDFQREDWREQQNPPRQATPRYMLENRGRNRSNSR